MNNVTDLINYLYNHRLMRYLFVGGTTFIIDFGLLVLLHGKLNIPIAIATSISFWVAVTYNFFLNRSWTFSSGENKKLHKHLAAYGILLAFNYLFTVLFVSFFSKHIPYTVAKALSVILQTSWTYQIYKRVIFTSPNPSIAASIE
jgi:putative flippase GtrA